MEVKLPVTTRIKIRLHYLICVWCYRYGEQLQTLRKIASSLPEHVDDCRPETLPHSLKGRLKQALREMIRFICSRTNLSREQAYSFCSLTVDFHVTQTVNGEKGVHGLLKKGLLF